MSRRCASAARTSRCSPSTSSGSTAPRTIAVSTRAPSRRRSRPSRAEPVLLGCRPGLQQFAELGLDLLPLPGVILEELRLHAQARGRIDREELASRRRLDADARLGGLADEIR